MSNVILALFDSGVTDEEDLANGLDLTFEAVRSALYSNGRPLSNSLSLGARIELRTLHHDLPTKVLMHKYKTTVQEIKKALNGSKTMLKARPTQDIIVPTYSQLGSIEEVAAQLSSSVHHVKKVLRDAEVIIVRKRSNNSRLIAPEAEKRRRRIQTAISAGVNIDVIARKENVTTSYVYQLNYDSSRTKPRLSQDTWNELLQEAKKPNACISSLAKQYKVTRATIYRRLKEAT